MKLKSSDEHTSVLQLTSAKTFDTQAATQKKADARCWGQVQHTAQPSAQPGRTPRRASCSSRARSPPLAVLRAPRGRIKGCDALAGWAEGGFPWRAHGARRLAPPQCLTFSPRSAAERRAARKALQRPHGPKDFIPDGSAEQAEKLRLCQEEQWEILSEERVERLGNLVKAEWKPGQGIVELQSPAGKFWHTMGFSKHGKQYLLPEEALYLLECGSVQLFYRDLPLSIQEAYEILLSQEAVSLPHYQVFSHLKQLGYIVLRFDPSTLPSPYERQLNLESHCQSSGKHHRKRRGSPSPGSCEKKLKISENLPEAEGASEKAGGDCGGSNCLPMDEEPLSEQPKESDAGSGEGESNPLPLDTGQKDFLSPSRSRAGDHKGGSTGTHAPHWDFTTIILPNVASDQPCTHLPLPEKELLPENVPGREVDAAGWCARINQKQERLSRKEREQRDRESRYKSSVNADQEVRRCSNWQEYKALLEKRSQQRLWRRPPHLWDQAVTPLLRPDEATSAAVLLQQISVLQPSHILDGASWLQEDPEPMKIDFNVYPADAVAKFKKTNPGKPYVRMCVRSCSSWSKEGGNAVLPSFDEQIPSLRALKQVTYQSGDVPVVFALVDHGDIAFYSLKEFKLPVDINH
ncbi:tRNA-splicing endonuclease subunit Sen54 [Indicator indicator]|uniref:tRNA-splicing endonuclease subunit Sen54 n=1 Tax=Indicator indicator TaxID=1002788 RepID=UPI0023E0363A|nr:tRNA-splicing endonuclease subunit Sen54 [Indicator indicator]